MSMHLTNGNSNWIKEFSTDESWVLGCLVAMVVGSLVCLLVQCFSDKMIQAGSHATRFLFKMAICINMISCFCYMSYYFECVIVQANFIFVVSADTCSRHRLNCSHAAAQVLE